MTKARAPLKTVLITGATDGLGRATALLLAQRGYRVFAAGRSAEKRALLDVLAQEKTLPLETLELDVCEDASVQRAVREVFAKAGAIDFLINNAGVNFTAAVEDLRLEDWRRQFETNFFGVLRVTQAVLPHMRERRRGRIIMMSSVSGFVTAPTQGAYSSSKFALEAMSNALRLELYPFGVQVILIEPGYIVTGIQQAALGALQALSQPNEHWSLCSALCQVLRKRHRRPRPIENLAGRLRACDPASNGSARSKSSLPRNAVSSRREMVQAAVVG